MFQSEVHRRSSLFPIKLCKDMVKLFVGIDFSQKTFDATVIERGKLYEKGSHRVFDNNREGASELVSWVCGMDACGSLDDVLFCGEDTGLHSKTVSDGLADGGCFVWLANAFLVCNGNSEMPRGKNDKKDSRDIALYAARYEDKAVRHVAPGERMDALKELFSRRRFLVKQQGALRKRRKGAESVLKGNRLLKASFRSEERMEKFFEDEINSVERQMRDIIKSDAELCRTFAILTSMKGIGLVNAVAMIVYTCNFRKFGYDARKMASYWGVAPFARTSGTSLKGKPHVSRYADAYLKSLLSEAAICAMRFCPTIASYAQKLTSKGKHICIVRNNVKNKIIHILVAMVRDGNFFQVKS